MTGFIFGPHTTSDLSVTINYVSRQQRDSDPSKRPEDLQTDRKTSQWDLIHQNVPVTENFSDGPGETHRNVADIDP